MQAGEIGRNHRIGKKEKKKLFVLTGKCCWCAAIWGTPLQGRIASARNLTGLSRSLNGKSFWLRFLASPEGKLDFLAIGTPPLISHFHRFRKAAESDSFPPGEAKGKKPCAFTIQHTAQSRRLAGGFYPPLRGGCKPAWRAIPSPGGRAVPYGYNPRSVIVRRFRRPYGWRQRSYGAAALPGKRFHNFRPPPPGTPGNHPGKIPA